MIYVNSPGQKLMMSIDWLQWSGFLVTEGFNSLPDLICPETYRMEVLDGNQIFKYRAILYDMMGRKVITMLWKPKSYIMKYNLVVFQVANYWFYNGEPIDHVIKLAADCFDYSFATMTRLDICVDFEMKRKQKSIIKGLYHHRIICGGKQEGNLWWHVDQGEEFPHDFNFGSHKSDIKWKLYDKSRELKVGDEKEDKPYIVNSWKDNGMDIYKIWRLEVSISGFNNIFIKNQPLENVVRKGVVVDVRYSGRRVELTDINDFTMFEIFSNMYHKRFQLLKKQHTRRANDERVWLFDIENRKILVPIKREPGNHVDHHIMYDLIRVIEDDSAKRNTRMLENACSALFWYVKFNRLDKLFTGIKQRDIEDYINDKIDDVGNGIIPYRHKD